VGKLNSIIIDCKDADRASEFWSQALEGYQVDKQEWGVTTRSQADPMIYFEVVPEDRAVKNRLHLNIRAVDRPAEVKRLVALGATEIEEMSPGGGYVWTNMRDVEGNEFCVSQA
jgi:predicted enzyme related to lactoylglutathione lyase